MGALRMNFSRYEAWLDKEKLELTPKEYELLKLFITNTDRVFSREQLLEKVWGYEYFGDTRTVDTHIKRIRQKLEVKDDSGWDIKTVWGVGYKFEAKP